MSAHDGPVLTIIMPVYNEAATFRQSLEGALDLPLSKEIIIIDDASTDGTRALVAALQHPQTRVVLKERNTGKGESVQTGIALARGRYAVVHDGDLEYEPRDLLRLVERVQEPGVLAAFGSRQIWLRQSGKRLPVTFHNLGRRFLDVFFRALYGGRLTDVSTCYRMAPVAVLRAMKLREQGFDADFETLAKLYRCARSWGKRIVEEPVAYHPRSPREGKKITWRDGFGAVRTLLKYRFWRCPPEPL